MASGTPWFSTGLGHGSGPLIAPPWLVQRWFNQSLCNQSSRHLGLLAPYPPGDGCLRRVGRRLQTGACVTGLPMGWPSEVPGRTG